MNERESEVFFMVAKTSDMSTSSTLLRGTLQLDGAVSAVGALAFLAVGFSPLSDFLGFTEPAFPLIVGVILIAYVVWLFRLTRRREVDRRQAMGAVAINDAWVVISIVLLVINLPPLTLWGKLFVGLIAVVVAAFAIVEFYALRKS
ncbi:hypothetical protein [Reticulibacter mediterranei]|nr:hypothetical protein [Reticulibacter mediterranei]